MGYDYQVMIHGCNDEADGFGISTSIVITYPCVSQAPHEALEISMFSKNNTWHIDSNHISQPQSIW